jgi:hypothetical protein
MKLTNRGEIKMKKLTMIGLSLLALAAIGCSNNGANNNANTNCVISANGTYVSTTTGQICSSSALGTQACYGTYYFYNGSTWLTGICSGSNCSGYTLYNSAGQQVRCQ